MIGVAAQMLGVHPQTLRLYERLGFIVPSRTKGKTRIYSQKNLEQVRTIITLTRRHGVNLAGVEIILKLERSLENLKQETQELFEALRQNREKGLVRPHSTGPDSRPRTSRSPAVKIKVERG